MFFYFLVFSLSCTPQETTDTQSNNNPSAEPSSETQGCEQCLANGGTWQPEAQECTENCEIQDISCFTETCPGSCEENCSYCFDSVSCEEAECTWHQEAEAMWCTE